MFKKNYILFYYDCSLDRYHYVSCNRQLKRSSTGTHHRAFGSINGPPEARLPSLTEGTVDEEMTLNCNVNGKQREW